MGWVMLLAAVGAAVLLAWLLKVRGAALRLFGAALMLGATGYAMQGRPELGGRPAVTAQDSVELDTETAALREAMFGRFTLDNAYLIAADAMSRSGDDAAAVKALLGGLRKIPRSVELWTALGGALARHDGDRLSPAAMLAFEQAARLAPEHPGPPFFLGLARVRADDLAGARGPWRKALALAPPGQPYRRDIAVRVLLLDRFLALQAAQAGRRQQQ